MSLITSPITGRVPLPTGQAFPAASLSLTLSAWDREGAEILLPATVTAALDATGALPADFALWANSAGLREEMRLSWPVAQAHYRSKLMANRLRRLLPGFYDRLRFRAG